MIMCGHYKLYCFILRTTASLLAALYYGGVRCQGQCGYSLLAIISNH